MTTKKSKTSSDRSKMIKSNIAAARQELKKLRGYKKRGNKFYKGMAIDAQIQRNLNTIDKLKAELSGFDLRKFASKAGKAVKKAASVTKKAVKKQVKASKKSVAARYAETLSKERKVKKPEKEALRLAAQIIRKY
jgi:hypothetical protein